MAPITELKLEDVAKLRGIFEMHNSADRQRMYNLFEEDVFQLKYGEDLRSERETTLKRWNRLRELGVFDGVVVGGDAMLYDAIIESVGLLDHSLEVKMGVHYGLFGTTIAKLGSKEQRERWISKVEDCSMPGCFALTELGHGSNVRGIETVVTYEKASEEFIINTPTETAQKYWIGGAADGAHWTTAFAQLILDDVNHGVHPFVVRLRDDSGRLAKGVFIADCGHKNGLNGVDNGRIWFDHVRLPRDQMLCGMSQVSADGTYSSAVPDPELRFSAQLAALTGGRISIAHNSNNQAKIGLATAIRYSLSRRAFGPPGGEEVPLMYYQIHKARLMPCLATTFVHGFATNELKTKWYSVRQGLVTKEVHVWSSGFKALMSFHMRDALQTCREACGGQGYKSENRIGVLRSDRDVCLTFEGDNHVLLQQVAKAILPQFMKETKTGTYTGDLQYLNAIAVPPERNLAANLSFQDPEHFSIVLGRYVFRLLHELAKSIEEAKRIGFDDFGAWNESQNLAIALAKGHVQHIIWRVFQARLQDIRRDPSNTRILSVLEDVGRLHAAEIIQSSAGLLAYESLSVRESQTIRKEHLKLCKKLSVHARQLVDSFGIPDHLLGPIAHDWVDLYSKRRAKL